MVNLIFININECNEYVMICYKMIISSICYDNISLLSTQAVMRNLVRRYVTQEQRKAENEGVTEDDVNEIKNSF